MPGRWQCQDAVGAVLDRNPLELPAPSRRKGKASRPRHCPKRARNSSPCRRASAPKRQEAPNQRQLCASQAAMVRGGEPRVKVEIGHRQPRIPRKNPSPWRHGASGGRSSGCEELANARTKASVEGLRPRAPRTEIRSRHPRSCRRARRSRARSAGSRSAAHTSASGRKARSATASDRNRWPRMMRRAIGLVEADRHADEVRMALGERHPAPSSSARSPWPVTTNWPPRLRRSRRRCIDREIDALLMHEARDDGEKRPARARAGRSISRTKSAFAPLPFHVRRRKAARDADRLARVQSSADAVDDARQPAFGRAHPQQPVAARSRSRRA